MAGKFRMNRLFSHFITAGFQRPRSDPPRFSFLFAFALLAFSAATASAGVNVLTQHNDNLRTGANLNETILTPDNVNSTSFGLLFEQPVDGYVYAQPLYMSGLTIGGSTHNVVFVATENDSVYAFDADGNSGPNAAPLWHTSFINPANGITAIPWQDTTTTVIYPTIGITGTPVIDSTTGVLYVVAATKEKGAWFQRLHALDIHTGLEKPGSPVTITGTASGTGTASVNGVIQFDPLTQCNRAGLLLQNGVVYVAWGSHADHGGPSHGWLMAYDAQSLALLSTFNTTPDGTMGTIWMSGCGPAADAAGNVFVATGNGDFGQDSNGNHIGNDYGDSVLKFSTANRSLTLTDYFTPANAAYLYAEDKDLASGGLLLLPDQPGPHPHMGIITGKDPVTYVFNADRLGGFHPNPPVNQGLIEVIPNATGLCFDTPAYFNGSIYYHGSGVLKQFAVQNGLVNPVPVSSGTDIFPYPGATPSISASGTANGIVWEIMHTGLPGNGISDPTQADPPSLRASLASDVSQRLYSSDDAGLRDVPGGQAVKFTVPTVANGKVYIGTSQTLSVFGLLSSRLLVNVNGPGLITSGYEGSTLQVLDSVLTLTASDAQYGTFDSWTDVNGNLLTRSPSYTFVMTPMLVLNANFIYQAYPRMAGQYTGIIQGATPGPAGAGTIDLTVTTSGQFTASILFGGHRIPVSGQMLPDGSLSTTLNAATASPTTLTLQITDGDLTGSVSYGAATGYIAGGALVSTAHPVPSALVGKYTLLLPPPANPTSMPKGVGYACVSVDKLGHIRSTGVLGNGKPFSQGAMMTRVNTWPFTTSLPGNGLLSGLLAFEHTSTPSDIDGQLFMYQPGSPPLSAVIDSIGSAFKPANPILPLDSGRGTLTLQLPSPVSAPVKSSTRITLGARAPLTLKTNPLNGIFTGIFTSGKTSGRYGGAILQDQNSGRGTFILSGTTGAVNLQ
jgi:hypothetical protein